MDRNGYERLRELVGDRNVQISPQPEEGESVRFVSVAHASLPAMNRPHAPVAEKIMNRLEEGGVMDRDDERVKYVGMRLKLVNGTEVLAPQRIDRNGFVACKRVVSLLFEDLDYRAPHE